ncbi:MAG: hypothetical protein ACYC46_15830 [Acidobacteriaceae bacterium]
MKRAGSVLTASVALVAALSLVGMTGCGGGGSSAPPGVGTLTLALDNSLDDGGSIKAPSITTAKLLSPAGVVVATATLAGGNANFSLDNVSQGDYLIKVNGLDNDLVPTRIANTTDNVSQFVGQKLRASVIGTVADPTYRIKTYSQGQGEHVVVKYSDNTAVSPPRYAYAIIALKTTPLKIEIRMLDNAALLTSFSPTSTQHPFATWILGSTTSALSGIDPSLLMRTDPPAC